ncbi:CHAT domain-containing protein [Streptomyces sp. IBSNAI002]|uniref:CHAT domain-containing protein n=1 Tax=Streptomyces sp. IBSNAI002 TaxID=3457500 RepID=UPI003FD5BD87
MTSLQADGYPELRARVTLFEERGDARPLCDPAAAERALGMAAAWRAHPDGADFDVVHTLATLLWQHHLFRRRLPGARRADGRSERRTALFLYAWADAFLPASVPAEVRAAVRALPRLPRTFKPLRRDPRARISALGRHGLAALNRYDRLRDRPTLQLGLDLMLEAVDATPPGSPYADTLGMEARCALGTGLQRMLHLTGDLRVLPSAVALGREALRRCPDGHPERPRVLFNLASLLLDSHLRAGDDGALVESMHLALRALALTPEADPDRRERLAHVAHLHSLAYDRTRDPHQLRRAVAAGREAVRSRPSEPPVRDGRRLHNLAKDLHTLYEADGDLQALRESVSTQRRAVAATAQGSPQWAGRRHNLAAFLMDLAEATTDAETVRLAVAVCRENLRHAPPGHAEHSDSLDNLYRALELSGRSPGHRETTAELVDTARRRAESAGPGAAVEAALVLAETLKRAYDSTGELSTLVECADLYRRLTGPAAAGHPPPQSGTPLGDLLAFVDVLQLLYLRREDLDALDEAEQVARRALALAPDTGIGRAIALAKLGGVLDQAVERATDVHTAGSRTTESFTCIIQAEEACPEDDGRYPAMLLGAGQACLGLYRRSGLTAALVKAHAYLRQEALALPPDDPNGAQAGAALAELLLTRHRCTAEEEGLLGGFPDDLPGAVAAARAACAAAAAHDPLGKDEFSLLLARVLEEQAATGGVPRAAAEAEEICRTITSTTTARPHIVQSAAGALARAAMARGDAAAALAAVEQAVAQIPLIAPRDLARRDRQHLLQGTAGLANTAAEAAVAAGRPERAVELLEQCRGRLHAEVLPGPDDEIEALRRSHPALALEYEKLRAASVREPAAPLPGSGQAEERYRRGARWTALLERIRSLPGHEGFLRPPAIGLLAREAEPGPVVFVYTGPRRSDALVLRPGTAPGHHVEVVPLPLLVAEEALARMAGLPEVVGAAADAAGFGAREQAQEDLHGLLEWLWDAIAAPVLDHLGIDGSLPEGGPPRIWWCPVGFLARLPLQAAGRHRAPRTADRLPPTLLDRTVSSTTTTLRALGHSRSRVRARRNPGGPVPATLVVAMPRTPGAEPLSQAAAEADITRGLLEPHGAVTTLIGAQATASAVRARLLHHGLAHFVCHGVGDPADPSRGRLLLADHQSRPLSVSEIAGLRLEQAELVYLSACGTAVTSPRLADEAVHIAAAFQLSGYPHAIGTLWPVVDRAAAAVAEGFYLRLTDGGTRPADTADAARALNETLRDLRDRYPLVPTRWAAHLHVGA